MASEAVRVEYSKMRAQISTIAQKIHELDQERNEYEYVMLYISKWSNQSNYQYYLPLICVSVFSSSLVVKALDPMDKERKCFRLVGGVLVERTVKEVLPAIAHNLEGVRICDSSWVMLTDCLIVSHISNIYYSFISDRLRSSLLLLWINSRLWRSKLMTSVLNIILPSTRRILKRVVLPIRSLPASLFKHCLSTLCTLLVVSVPVTWYLSIRCRHHVASIYIEHILPINLTRFDLHITYWVYGSKNKHTHILTCRWAMVYWL